MEVSRALKAVSREPKLTSSTPLPLQQACTTCSSDATSALARSCDVLPPRVSSLAGERRLLSVVPSELISTLSHRYKKVEKSKPSKSSIASTGLKAALTLCRPSSSRSRPNSRPRSITRSPRGRRSGLASLTASVYSCRVFSNGSLSELSGLHAFSTLLGRCSARAWTLFIAPR